MPRTPSRPGSPARPSSLRNLGPVCDERLAAVGIETAERLDEVGAVEAYRRLKERFPRRTSVVFLYALEGALLDLPWNELPRDVLAGLRREAEKVDRDLG